MRIAFQMDPVEGLNIAGDTSFALALEAQKRGHEIFIYPPRALSMLGESLYARVQKCTFRDVPGDHAQCAAPQRCALTDFDVIMMRQNPPFDMGYITATYFLEKISADTLIVNDPAAVRDAPEKIFPLLFSQFMPPTLMSSDMQEIHAFRQKHKAIVLKPLYGAGGEAVMVFDENDANFDAAAALMLSAYQLPLIAQEFIPGVRQGDKRIFFVDGEPLAQLNRVPPKNQIRANLQWGGDFSLEPMTPQEQKICDALSPALRENGLLLAGIDVIAGHLTEINITSPTGMRQIQNLGGPDIAAIALDAIEKKAKEHKK